MTKLYNRQIMRFRRKELRKNTTPTEGILWKILQKYFKEARFRRQYSVGPYILDFYSTKHRIAIEADGEYHLQQKEYDSERDNFLRGNNIIVLRFTNNEIGESIGDVAAKIRGVIMAQK